MYCLSLAFWEGIAIWVVVLIAVIALLRLLIAALGGPTTFWPPATNPLTTSGPAPSGLIGFLAAALNIVIWAIIALAVIYLVFTLLSCLIGYAPPFRPLRP